MSDSSDATPALVAVGLLVLAGAGIYYLSRKAPASTFSAPTRLVRKIPTLNPLSNRAGTTPQAGVQGGYQVSGFVTGSFLLNEDSAGDPSSGQ